MEEVHVIIVGAGASGIATACRLLEQGFSKITVLEAENRIGGRIYTKELGHGIIDMGAQWVHGEKGNVVFSMANPKSLLTESITSLFDDTTTYVQSSGKSFKIDEMDHIFKLIMEIDHDSKIFFKTNSGSVGNYFTSEFKKRLKEKCIPTEEWPLAYNILDWYEKLENSIDAADSWFETSGNGLTQYWDCEGNLLWSWKSGGYKTVLDILMRKNTDEKSPAILNNILLNKEVEIIKWNNIETDIAGKVSVKCIDGSTYIGDHVIVTVSLGVLKEKACTLFSPPLPEEKITSIQGLSFGIVDKIFLKFPYRWWPPDVQGYNVLWSEDDKSHFSMNRKARDKSWLQGVFGFWALDNQPLVLYTWAVGPRGKQMEELTDAEVVEDLMELLHRYLGNKYNIPEPVEIKRSDWGTNPHFRGSYSLRSLDSDRLLASASKLAQPVLNAKGREVLLFAGEATHDHYYSTVHGAIETGWREADRLTKMYRQYNTCKVLIVGAGISGLAAAKTLLDQGLDDLLILEAQDRPGGRISSLRHQNGWLEAGAQWIHGQNSEIWRLSSQFNLLSDVVSSEGEGLYLREDGRQIEPQIVLEVYSVISEILEECEQLVNSNSLKNLPKSIGHHLRHRFMKYLENCQETEEIKNIKNELYNWHVRFQVIDNSCSTLDKLSAKAWGKYIFCGGADYVNFKEGYSSLVQCIVDTLPSGMLKVNYPVKRISWKPVIEVNRNVCTSEQCKTPHSTKGTFNGECVTKCTPECKNCEENKGKMIHDPVEIECEDGTLVVADHVIITCSLGYLKENYRKMFFPELPEGLCKAIEDLGFSTINKVFLSYEKQWWSRDVKGFQLIWTHDKAEISDSSEDNSWTRDLTGFDVLHNHKAVLLGWVGGRGAKMVEKLSEIKIAEHCTALLQKFTQRNDIPKPEKVIRTSWHGNPYVRGAYSNTSTECDVSNVGPSTLAEPVFTKVIGHPKSVLSSVKYPSLLFAGEATHENFFSTTHGAYESGKKQAEVILSYHKLISEVIEES